MKNGTNRQQTCDWALERVHLRLDGERLVSEELALLERHLVRCGDCTAAAKELAQLQSNMRGLAEIPLPDAALDEVWSRTSRRRGWLSMAPWPVPQWRLAAAAATLALVLIGIWQFALPLAVPPPIAENHDVDRAVAELKIVFGVTAQALHRTETALDEVLVERISPALEKVPPPWFRRAEGKDDV